MRCVSICRERFRCCGLPSALRGARNRARNWQAQERTFDSCLCVCVCFAQLLLGLQRERKPAFCCAGSYPGSLQGWFTSFELVASYEVGPTSSRARTEPRYHARSFAVRVWFLSLKAIPHDGSHHLQPMHSFLTLSLKTQKTQNQKLTEKAAVRLFTWCQQPAGMYSPSPGPRTASRPAARAKSGNRSRSGA